MAQQTIPAALAGIISEAASRYAAGGVDAVQLPAISIAQAVGRPFVAKFGAITGQEAVKVRELVLANAVAYAEATNGRIVWTGAIQPRERTISVVELEALQARSAEVLGEYPVTFDKFGLTPEFLQWLRQHGSDLRTRLGCDG